MPYYTTDLNFSPVRSMCNQEYSISKLWISIAVDIFSKRFSVPKAWANAVSEWIQGMYLNPKSIQFALIQMCWNNYFLKQLHLPVNWQCLLTKLLVSQKARTSLIFNSFLELWRSKLLTWSADMFQMIIFFTFFFFFWRRLDISINNNGRLKKLDFIVSRCSSRISFVESNRKVISLSSNVP